MKYRALGIIVVLVALTVLAVFYFGNKREDVVAKLVPGEVLVIRTIGGMLEVSTLIKNEEFSWQTTWDCKFFNCSGLGKTVSTIRVPAHYTYRVRLENEWKLKFNGTSFDLEVPRVEPLLPVAIDSSKMQLRTARGWLAPDKLDNRDNLLKMLGAELIKRATQESYIRGQDESAKKTIAEFAKRWMLEQASTKNADSYNINVTFK